MNWLLFYLSFLFFYFFKENQGTEAEAEGEDEVLVTWASKWINWGCSPGAVPPLPSNCKHKPTSQPMKMRGSVNKVI